MRIFITLLRKYVYRFQSYSDAFILFYCDREGDCFSHTRICPSPGYWRAWVSFCFVSMSLIGRTRTTTLILSDESPLDTDDVSGLPAVISESWDDAVDGLQNEKHEKQQMDINFSMTNMIQIIYYLFATMYLGFK